MVVPDAVCGEIGVADKNNTLRKCQLHGIAN